MIDTVVLLIPLNEFRIKDYDTFTPSAQGILEAPFYSLKGGSFRCYQNSTKDDKKSGRYKPKLTLTKSVRSGGYSIALKIEFSAPKLIYGNNFDELEETDFDKVIDTLYSRLKDMSISISRESLYHAEVVGIHYGKNIVFTDRTTSSLIINILAKLDVSKRLDAGNTDFRNNGQAIRFHANSYELTFYDKIKDLQQGKISERRAFESDNYIQKDILKYKPFKSSLEVLRMELRFNGKRKLKDTMQKLGINKESTQFYHLFNKEIVRRMLNHFWDIAVSKSLHVILLSEKEPSVLLHKLLSHGIKESKAIQILGALQVINETGQGIRGLKQVISSKGNTYRRIAKELNTIDLSDNYLHSQFKQIK